MSTGTVVLSSAVLTAKHKSAQNVLAEKIFFMGEEFFAGECTRFFFLML